MNFTKLDWHNQQLLGQTMIDQFMIDNDLNIDIMPSLIELLEGFGIELDACSHCGAMPMNSNCNNAGCE